MPKSEIRVIHRVPNGEPEIKTITESLETLKGLIDGGWLEAVGFVDGTTLYCDEEGKGKRLEPNLDYFPHDIIVGPIIVAGSINNQGYHKDLTDSQIESAMKEIQRRSL